VPANVEQTAWPDAADEPERPRRKGLGASGWIMVGVGIAIGGVMLVAGLPNVLPTDRTEPKPAARAGGTDARFFTASELYDWCEQHPAEAQRLNGATIIVEGTAKVVQCDQDGRVGFWIGFLLNANDDFTHGNRGLLVRFHDRPGSPLSQEMVALAQGMQQGTASRHLIAKGRFVYGAVDGKAHWSVDDAELVAN
jgi:hypothetical protein